jgi:hypothetical protein
MYHFQLCVFSQNNIKREGLLPASWNQEMYGWHFILTVLQYLQFEIDSRHRNKTYYVYQKAETIFITSLSKVVCP